MPSFDSSGEPFRHEEGMFNWNMPSSCSRLTPDILFAEKWSRACREDQLDYEQKGDVHAERASLKAWRGRFLGEKNWEREVTFGKGKDKTSTGLGTSRTNVPIVLFRCLNYCGLHGFFPPFEGRMLTISSGILRTKLTGAVPLPSQNVTRGTGC